MSDEIINITIQEDPLPVIIDTGTPELTITDNQGIITVVEAGHIQTVIAEDNLNLIINNGGYAGTVTVLLDDLLGKLTRNQMSPGLASDLERLEALWTRIGSELLLTYSEGLDIQEAGRLYTDSSIIDAVADITITTDGKIDAAYSLINQTAYAITQTVTQIEGDLTDRFVVNESMISQTADSISSVVTRLDTIDGPGGSVELLQSSILQTASSIDLEVTARTNLEGVVTEATTSISLLSDSLTLASESISTLDDRVSSAEFVLGPEGINLSVLQESVSWHEYSIGTFQTLLANQWGVIIEEDVYGSKYATGFGLILHPTWIIGESYSIGNTVIYLDIVYECILANTADIDNSPTGTNGASYWQELPNGVKSAFTVQADSFKVLTSAGPTAVFEVTDDVITLNTDVQISGTITIGPGSTGYSNIDDAPTSLETLDATAYANLQLASTYALQAIDDAANAQSTADGKITAFYQINAPTSGMDTGDFWIDINDNNKMYTYTGSKWVVAQDQLIGNAINLAQTAQTTADGKAVVFYSSTTPSKASAGDLWYDTDDTQKRLYRYDGSSWSQVISTIGATWGVDLNNQPTSLNDINATEYSNLYTALSNASQALADAADAKSTADGKIYAFYQTTAPVSGMSVGDLWFDTDNGYKLYRYSGSAWINIQDSGIANAISAANNAQTTADGKAVVYYQASAPSSASAGDLWYDTDDTQHRTYRYNGSTWVPVSTLGSTWGTDISNQPTSLNDLNSSEYANLQMAFTKASQALVNAATAQSTADGKITSFYQTTSPVTGMDVGDFWIDTDNGNKLYRYSGSSWVKIQDDAIASAIDAAQTAQTTADSKAVIYYQTTAPSNASIGDLWYDTDDSLKRTYRYSGSDWAAISTFGSTWDTDIRGQPLNSDIYNVSQWRNGFEESDTNWKTSTGHALTYTSSGVFSGTLCGIISTFTVDTDSSGIPGGAYIAIPEQVALVFAGRRIVVGCYAKTPSSGGASKFSIAYSTNDVGNSGWREFTPTTSWANYTFTYDVPVPLTGGSDYLGIQGFTDGDIYIDNVFIILASDFDELANKPTSLSDLNSTEYNQLLTAASKASQALQNAATAQSTADGKITSFYQAIAPVTGMDIGDFWIDTDDGNKMYRYSGSSWVVVQDDAIGTAINAAQTAQTIADGKAVVYYQTLSPSGARAGDLWYNTNDTYKRLYRYDGSVWSAVATYGARWGTNIDNQPTSLININSTEYSRLPTSVVGAIAYLNSITDSYVTSITGNKIQTGVIYGNSSYSYWDLTNNKMYFTASANVEFAANAVVTFGAAARLTGAGGESITFINDQIYMTSTTGAYFYLYNAYSKLISDGNTSIVAGSAPLPIDDSVSTNQTACVVAAKNIYINPGTSYLAYIRFGSTNKIQINQYGMRSSTSNSMLLGDSGYYWTSCYATTYYDNGGGYQDLQDDLVVMSEFQPRKAISIDPITKEKIISETTEINPKTGLEYLDLLSLPRWMTNYDEVVKKLKEENGDLLSEEDIDELIQDQHEAGWLLCRNVGAFNDCTSGGLRQLDIEVKEVFELILSRLTNLENENKELKTRIAVLEAA